MITFITMLIQKVNSPAIVPVIILISWLIYTVLFLAVKVNRSKSHLKSFLITGAVMTLIADIIWFFKFFDNFEYLNPGIGGILWFAALPVLLILAVLYMSYVNASRYQYDEKKRKKEEAKQKKKERARKKYEKHPEETPSEENMQ